MLYIAGSFKFVREMKELEAKLQRESINYKISKEVDSHGIPRCLEKIDGADVMYVVDPNGYVGRSVCVDIGYAYAKGKPIYVMYPTDDPTLMSLIDDVISFEELINFLKHRNS